MNVIKFEELKNIVLVGHSYAGCVISGVAEQMLPAIASIVFVDAFLPEDGQRMLDLTPANLRDAALEAQSKGEIARPIVPAAAFKVNEQDQAWVNSKLTPQPLGPTFTPNRGGSISALRVTGDPAEGDPGGGGPPTPPPTPSFTGGILALRVTGTSHSPLSAG